MGVQLVAGERFNLIQASPGLQKIAIALGWNVPSQYEMDVSAFMLGEEGKLPNDQYFVFYNNVRSPDGSLRHANGTSTGKILGDDETLYLNFAKLDPAIQEIVFIVTIHDAEERKQSFGDIKTAFIRLEDVDTGSELARYNLQEPLTQETTLEFGRLYLKNGEWRFQAVGQGYSSGLQAFVDRYYPESSTLPHSQPTLTEDAQVIQQFLERVEQQQVSLQEASESANLSSASDNTEVEELSVKPQTPAITAEELLERYKAGERDFSNLNFREIKLSDFDLSNCNFSNANLEGAILNQVNLSASNLTRTNFSNAVFSKSIFYSSDLTESNLTNAKIEKARFERTNLTRSKLIKANLIDSYFHRTSKFDEADMSESNLTKACFVEATLSQVNLSHANLSQAKFLSANFETTNLKDTNLEGAICKNTRFPENFNPVNSKAFVLSPNAYLNNINLSGWHLPNINLTGSSLSKANLSQANLESADLTQADLSKANLSKATLYYVKFLQANLASANLSEARLHYANLTAVNLYTANLIQADLTGANLAAAYLVSANLKNAVLAGVNFGGQI
uniref:TerD family protein n=1 Tax=Desertifilum tharense IPPAS B-1220 TaxID=1781255 RepID=A0ACD5GPG0_9CYAN